jgi:spore coat polysaccharide biosynthesis protein SpsF (cytidylyltransferase family)
VKVVAVTQARTGSSRFPGKILKEVNKKTLLEIHIDRLKQSLLIDDIYIATTNKPIDAAIEKIAEKNQLKYFKGSEDDVLDRFYKTLSYIKCQKPDYVIRVTSDCPLIDPLLIDEIISSALERNLDYYSNTMDEKYPDGQDVEIFKFKALEKAWFEATLKSDREHVTPYIIRNSTYKGGNLFHADNHFLNENYNNVRMTVDEPNDLEVIKLLISNLGLNRKWQDYTEFYLKNEDIRKLNRDIERNQGYHLSIEKE